MLNCLADGLSIAGLGFVGPVVRLCRGHNPRAQLAELGRLVGVPLVAIAIFLLLWGQLSASIETSLGEIPGPTAVWRQAGAMYADHRAERARADAFYQRQSRRNAQLLTADPAAPVPTFVYTGQPTYIDQIVTSLQTVFTGFLLASLIAIPLGILSGLSRSVNAAINPFVQIFRPVSPLAWLPIVTMIVSSTYVSTDPLFQKSFITSAVTVALCSLWPT
ncbi:MAG: ABC transporter permease, partial [Vicinamibacterales bacterium]